MKATFDGQDYTLILDKAQGELRRLKEASLETQLKDHWSDQNLDKKVILQLGENNGPDGIELAYTPENAVSWEAIQEVNVTINENAYDFVRQRGEFGTRYNGSDKIMILNGMSR